MTDLAVLDLDADAARELTDQIKGRVAELLPLIVEAYQRRAWTALGYASWEDYCDTELRGLRLPVERREAVRELRSAGMSTRAIGSAVGTSEATVRRDLSTASNDAVEPERVLSRDGRERPAVRPSSPLVEAVAESIRETAERTESSGVDLRAYVDSDPDVKAAQFMHRFDTALGRALPVVEFDPERVARLAESHEIELLRRHADSLSAFADKVVRARRGFRLIQGEAQ